METGAEQNPAPAANKRLTGVGKAARRKRIFARLREGWAYDEIAREEGITARRARQIVSEVLRRREVDDGSDHALLQLSRLAPALRAAGEAVGQGKTTDKLINTINFYAAAEAYLEEDKTERSTDEAAPEAEARQEEESWNQAAAPAAEGDKKEFWPVFPR